MNFQPGLGSEGGGAVTGAGRRIMALSPPMSLRSSTTSPP